MRRSRRTLAGALGLSLAGLLSLGALASPGPASPGTLDSSFGDGGVVTTAFPAASKNGATAEAILLEPGGKIVVVGSSGSDFALARYQPDGTLDASFGDGGRVSTDLGGIEEASAAVLQPDGRIVVAGSSDGHRALVRYEPDGALDPTFGDGGEVISGVSSVADAVALEPDGRILVAGGAARRDCRQVNLARYEPDGSLDPSFGDGGEATTRLGCAGALLLQADGRFVVAGSRPDAGGVALARYEPDGAPDASFGDGGRVSTDLRGIEEASAAVLEPDGRIVVAGSSGDHSALVRFEPDGAPDPSFGDGGETVTPRHGSDRASALLLERDGKLIVAGTARTRGSRQDRFALSRYGPDGSLDPSFGHRGWAISKPGEGTAAALQPNGSLIAAGRSAVLDGPAQTAFEVLRFNGGSPSPARGAITDSRDSAAPSDPGKRNAQRRSRPPHSVPAWYINAHSFKELKRFAATDACAFARSQPRSAQRALILDFGGARAYRGGAYGAALNHEAFLATNKQIRSALQVASDAYAACHRRGQARIAYANTNHFETKLSAHLARRVGVHQARTMRHVRAYQRRRGYGRAERAGVAGDIEMGFWGPKRSKELVNGAKSVWHRGFIDFGTAGGCPPYPKGLHLRGCFNGWRVRDVAHVSHAGGGAPVPEIYFLGGPHHFDQAAEWATVARSWNARHRTRYRFLGATGSTEFSSLTPQESWNRLRKKAPGRVRRELLNFKQDETLQSAAARGRAGDGP